MAYTFKLTETFSNIEVIKLQIRSWNVCLEDCCVFSVGSTDYDGITDSIITHVCKLIFT